MWLLTQAATNGGTQLQQLRNQYIEKLKSRSTRRATITDKKQENTPKPKRKTPSPYTQPSKAVVEDAAAVLLAKSSTKRRRAVAQLNESVAGAATPKDKLQHSEVTSPSRKRTLQTYVFMLHTFTFLSCIFCVCSVSVVSSFSCCAYILLHASFGFSISCLTHLKNSLLGASNQAQVAACK